MEASGGAPGGLINMGCCLKCEGHPGEQEMTKRNCEAGLVALERGLQGAGMEAGRPKGGTSWTGDPRGLD